jgi:serine/threonine-protein kinase
MLKPRILSGRYRLGELLGAGGMSIVYRATDLRLGREVAVKVLPPNLAADALVARRFGAEARRVAAIAHPNLVTIHDVGDDLGDPYYVMEIIEGETMEQLLRRESRLAPAAATRIVSQVAGALDALHAERLIHRDVKPANILLAIDGDAHLADFGLVRGELDGMTAPGIAVGTLSYLAPELLRGESAGPASDAYALAAVAYRALTGTLPYAARTIADLVEAQRGRPAPMSSLQPELAPAMNAVVMAALGPAGDRPTVSAFAASLAAAAEGDASERVPEVPVAPPDAVRALSMPVPAVAAETGLPSPDATTHLDTVVAAGAAPWEVPDALPGPVVAGSRSAAGRIRARALPIAVAGVLTFAVVAAAGFPGSSRRAAPGEVEPVDRTVATATDPAPTDKPAPTAPPIVLADVRPTATPREAPPGQTPVARSNRDDGRQNEPAKQKIRNGQDGRNTPNHESKHKHDKKHGHAKKHKHDKKHGHDKKHKHDKHRHDKPH